MNTTMERPAAPTREINSLRDVRRALKRKYGTLTIAAQKLGVGYQILGDTLNGRRNDVNAISAIKQEFVFSDEKIRSLWPLLRKWPREVA